MLTVQKVVSLFRSAMRDTAEPYLWSDEDVLLYLNQARLELCQRAWGISDTLSITFNDGALVPLPTYVTKIKLAYAPNDGRTIPLRAYTEVRNPFDTHTSGSISCLLTGIEEGKLKAYPAPSTPVVVRLVVLRYPTTFIDVVDDRDVEFAEDAVSAILAWMRHEAYSKEDSETFDRGQADYFFSKFSAFADAYRRMHERRETQSHTVKLPSGGYW